MPQRLIAVLTAFSLLGATPGAQPLFAQSIRIAGPSGTSIPVPAANPQGLPGGSAFPDALQPGWTLTPAGLAIPPGTFLEVPGAAAAGQPAAAAAAPRPVKAEGKDVLAGPLPRFSEVSSTLDGLTSENVGKLSPADARDGGDTLQRLIEGIPDESRPAVSLAEFSGAPRPAVAGTAIPAAGRLATAAVPEPAPEIRPPGLLTRLYLRPVLWARSVRHYFLATAADNWREYRQDRIRAMKAVAEQQGRDGVPAVDHPAAELAVSDARAFFGDVEALAVRDGRNFFADERMIGQRGVRTVGTLWSSKEEAVREALAVFDRRFDHPRLDKAAARAAFESFAVTAMRTESDRRASSLPKRLRKALVAASNARPEQVADAFRLAQGTLVAMERAGGLIDRNQRWVLRDFAAVVRTALAEEAALEPSASRRAVAVVVLGSFASGVARATSDLDIQVVTADGSSTRVAPFVQRLQAAWKGVNPINAAHFGFPPSREIFQHIHYEPFLVISHDAGLERTLSPPAGWFDGRSAVVKQGLLSRVERAVWRGSITVVQRVTDFQDRMAAPFKAEATSNPIDEKAAKRALLGLSAARMLSIGAFILTMVAFAKLGTSLVPDHFADLKALGSVMSIVMGPITGKLIDKVTLRWSMSFNAALRIAIGLALPALVYLGFLDPTGASWKLFAWLLAFSMVMNWNITSTMIAEDRLVPAITKEKNLRGINALLQIEYFGLSVLLGVFLGWGRIVDSLTGWLGQMQGFSAVFAISAAVHVAVLALYWWAIPNIRPAPKKPEGEEPGEKRAAAPDVPEPSTAVKILTWAGLLGAGTAMYFWLDTTIPLVVATIIGVAVSKGFKLMWREPIMRASLVFNMLVGFLFYPMNEVIIPFLTKTQSGMFQASLAGSMFFGQLIATSTRVQFPKGWNEAFRGWVKAKMRVKLPEAVTLERILMTAAFALSGVWLWFYLFPGSLAALGLGLLASATLFVVSASLTDRGWLKGYGIFMTAGIGLAYASFQSWGSPAFLMVGFLLIGLGFGPNKVTLDTGIQKEAKKLDPSQVASVMGIKSALTSAALALGFAVTRPVVKLPFPEAFLPIAGAFAIALVLFWLAPRWLGSVLSERSFKAPEWLRRLIPGASRLPPSFWFKRAWAMAAAGWFGAQALAPRPTAAQAVAALEDEIVARGIKVLMVDYDGTLMDKSEGNKAVPADEDLLWHLAELQSRTGVKVVVNTNHFFAGDANSMSQLLMDRMAPSSRKGLMAVVQSGSRIYEYGPHGEAPETFAWQAPPFDAAERAKVAPAFEAAAREAGLEPGDFEVFQEDSRTLIEVKNHHDRVDKVLAALEKANRENRWGYIVQLKPFPTMRKGQVPYVQYFKAHKGTGARTAFERLKAAKLVESESQVLIIGDDFKRGGNDLYMAKALPGALAVALGEDTDPAQANVLPWHRSGAAGSREILRALIRSLDGTGDKPESAGGPTGR